MAAPLRVSLERLATKGHLGAIEMLEAGPEMPEALDYLLGYYDELALARGMGMSGWDPIRYADIRAWSELMDVSLAPHEVEALVHLDVATRNPGKYDEDEEEVVVAMKDLPWPEKK